MEGHVGPWFCAAATCQVYLEPGESNFASQFCGTKILKRQLPNNRLLLSKMSTLKSISRQFMDATGHSDTSLV